MGYSAGRDLLPPVLRDLARHSAEGQTVAVIDARGEAYRNLAAGHRHASLFSSPPWIEAVGTAYGLTHRGFGPAAGRAGSKPRSRSAGSPTFAASASPACPSRTIAIHWSRIRLSWADLVAPILAAGVPVRLRCLRNALPTADDRLRVAGHALWHGVDLTRGEDEIWSGLDGQARQNVRKAERHGVVVRRSFSLDDLRLFHGMHAEPPQVEIPDAGAAVRVLRGTARGARPRGADLPCCWPRWRVPLSPASCSWNGATRSTTSSTPPSTPTSGPTTSCSGKASASAGAAAWPSLDFGLSDADQPGLVRYKAKFATEERAISMLEWRPEGHADPRGEEVGRTLHRMTRLLTEPSVPDTVTRAAGDELYRYFC